MHGREKVGVVVQTIRSTGALDDLWSAAGTRDEVAAQVRTWQAATDSTSARTDLAEVVLGLPDVPDAGRWLNAVGLTTGQLWVWVTSTQPAPETEPDAG